MPSGPDFFSVGELLFIAMVLAVIATVLGSGIAALMHDRSRPSPAPRAFKWLGVGIAVYMAIVLAFSVKPPAVAAPRKGDPQCLAHRCVTVTGLTRMTRGEETEYVLTLRLTNSGRYPFSDQIKGVYLVDSGGRRYGPSPDPGVAPLNDELGPNSEVL